MTEIKVTEHKIENRIKRSAFLIHEEGHLWFLFSNDNKKYNLTRLDTGELYGDIALSILEIEYLIENGRFKLLNSGSKINITVE